MENCGKRSIPAMNRECGRNQLHLGIRDDLEGSRGPLRTCSACHGDYEDPDRTAWTPGAEDDEELRDERAEYQGDPDNEFPADDL